MSLSDRARLPAGNVKSGEFGTTHSGPTSEPALAAAEAAADAMPCSMRCPSVGLSGADPLGGRRRR